jgi:hypothetical protein
LKAVFYLRVGTMRAKSLDGRRRGWRCFAAARTSGCAVAREGGAGYGLWLGRGRGRMRGRGTRGTTLLVLRRERGREGGGEVSRLGGMRGREEEAARAWGSWLSRS